MFNKSGLYYNDFETEMLETYQNMYRYLNTLCYIGLLWIYLPYYNIDIINASLVAL